MNIPVCYTVQLLHVFYAIFVLHQSLTCSSEPLQQEKVSAPLRQHRDLQYSNGGVYDCFQNCVRTACYSEISTNASSTTHTPATTTRTSTATSTPSGTSLCSAVSGNEIAYFPPTAAEPTESQAVEIVDVHNNYRRSFAAKNMRKLNWSACAASNAQYWANTCPSSHDMVGQPNARRIPGFSYCGQNIAWNTGSVPLSWTDAIRLWHDEVRDFVYCGAPYSNAVVGHFTQIMWANTSLVGCGMRTGCPAIPSLGLDQGPVNVFVCNYCTGGNLATGTNTYPDIYCPWEITMNPHSESCSQCPSGTACPSGDNLCV